MPASTREFSQMNLREAGSCRFSRKDLLEKIWNNCQTQNLYFLDKRNFLSPKQFGFGPGRSNLAAVSKLMASIVEFEQCKCASITMCDLHKTFDCVDHQRLLLKLLSVFGFRGKLLGSASLTYIIVTVRRFNSLIFGRENYSTWCTLRLGS